MMGPEDVLEVLGCLGSVGVAAWVDGGWGVDALLGEQTRPHDDLDLVIALDQAERALAALAGSAYRLHEDRRPTRLVARAPSDRRIDFHTVTFDADGGGGQALPGGGAYRYAPEGLAGHGTIAGHAVRCLSAEEQVRCHTGYTPDEQDRRDVLALHRRFGIPLPPPYQPPLQVE